MPSKRDSQIYHTVVPPLSPWGTILYSYGEPFRAGLGVVYIAGCNVAHASWACAKWVRFIVLQTEQGDGKHRLYRRGRRKASLRLPPLPIVLRCQAGIRKLAFLMPPP